MSMSLPRSDDKAALRVLDRKCADPNSIVSKRTTRRLATGSLDYKESFIYFSTNWGLGNLVRCALQAGVSPDTTTDAETGSMPMVAVAALEDAVPALKALLAGGANIELANKHGHTALGWAAQCGYLSCLQLLLDARANANAQDDLRNTPLMEAVMGKHVACARVLLPASELAITDRMGCTALHVSVNTASEACFELLLPLYDVDVRTVPGVHSNSGEAVRHFNMTALHFACLRGQLNMCKALLGRGADRMARDSEQWTPLHCAAQHGHLSCVVMLVGRQGKVRMTPTEVDAAAENGATALHWAAYYGCDQICGVLLGAGALLDSASDGLTPLMIAQHYHPTNAALLALLSGDGPSQPPGLVCDHCGQTAEGASVDALRPCGRCYVVRYCGKECQLAAWPGHKAACKARVEEREEKTRAVPRSKSVTTAAGEVQLAGHAGRR
jgi:ankyrin repeat protein